MTKTRFYFKKLAENILINKKNCVLNLYITAKKILIALTLLFLNQVV